MARRHRAMRRTSSTTCRARAQGVHADLACDVLPLVGARREEVATGDGGGHLPQRARGDGARRAGRARDVIRKRRAGRRGEGGASRGDRGDGNANDGGTEAEPGAGRGENDDSTAIDPGVAAARREAARSAKKRPGGPELSAVKDALDDVRANRRRHRPGRRPAHHRRRRASHRDRDKRDALKRPSQTPTPPSAPPPAPRPPVRPTSARPSPGAAPPRTTTRRPPRRRRRRLREEPHPRDRTWINPPPKLARRNASD